MALFSFSDGFPVYRRSNCRVGFSIQETIVAKEEAPMGTGIPITQAIQLEDMADCLVLLYPEFYFVVMFDHSLGHDRQRDCALFAHPMQLYQSSSNSIDMIQSYWLCSNKKVNGCIRRLLWFSCTVQVCLDRNYSLRRTVVRIMDVYHSR
jgi:hypothetical protein